MKSILILGALASVSSAMAGELKLVVIGGQITGKDIRAGLFASKAGFPNGTPLRTSSSRADGDRLTLRFIDLKPGDYVVSVYADSNGNGQLDTNLVGKPVEPYGFSRDARSLFGPPSFREAAIHLEGEAKQEIVIHLQ